MKSTTALAERVSDESGFRQAAAERFDWRRVVRLFHTSRAIDDLEENTLFQQKKVLYQFSARGHELTQILLGSLLNHKHDVATGYYRSRPLLLTLGLPVADALASDLGKHGFNDGRDVGVVFNFPNENGATVPPNAGGVGTQYTPTAGWAHAIRYYHERLGDDSYKGAIAVVLGGDGSIATNGFWASLNIATTRQLPMLFFIEDNAYGLSVPSVVQTPGGNIAQNLASFGGLKIFSADVCDIETLIQAICDSVDYVRAGSGPAMIRITMPRLSGHSGQDTQAYKGEKLIAEERSKDPIGFLYRFLVPSVMSEEEWNALSEQAAADVQKAFEEADARPEPNPAEILRHVWAEDEPVVPLVAPNPPQPSRMNMLTAIRRTLEHELRVNPKVLVFGEDVGLKGGVHAATMGLQAEFGADRVFDTSLSEEGIIGNAVGMASAGLRPVAEIQFRKYLEPGTEQLSDCGTMRWRTMNRFSAPVVVRIPGGFGPKCGDPWHSMSSEATFAHLTGWQVLYPSNAEDAVGLLRTALRSHNPSIFFEHRFQLDVSWARRPYPGDDYMLPLGVARTVQEGSELTVVTWGAMVERSILASQKTGASVEVIDLRSLIPWDKEAVLASVKKTRRCLIVHEDTQTCGFGGEIAATVAKESFLNLDAPVDRLAVADIPIPYNVGLMAAVVPSVESIAARMNEVLNF